ncbi:MAG: hypothetical protein M3N95_05535 [Actinomycetota bacterium]|nr:hypothetical protein [Actinomycetota bacterium]
MPQDGLITHRISVGCDATNAAAIGTILSQVPHELPIMRGERFALLAALARYDESDPTGTRGASHLAKDLVLAAALVHDDADERRTGEYLLRHRAEVTSGRRSAASLLAAARCAAEMDCRRLGMTEIAAGDVKEVAEHEVPAGRAADGSVAEVVLAYLDLVAGQVVSPPSLRDQIMTAATIALEVSERYRLNNGRGASVIAMRSDARPGGRLVTHLRQEFGPTPAAEALARILVGPDRTPIETSLLWWAARGLQSASALPDHLRARWSRSLTDLADQAPRIGRADCPQRVDRLQKQRVWTAVGRRPQAATATHTGDIGQVSVRQSPKARDVAGETERDRQGPAL